MAAITELYCIGCPMGCKIYFFSEFTVENYRYSGKLMEERRRRDTITKRSAFQANAIMLQQIFQYIFFHVYLLFLATLENWDTYVTY